jgi:hypothetical protein
MKLLVTLAMWQMLAADTSTPSAAEILARVEASNTRRYELLKEYTVLRQYTLQNARFGKQATASALMTYRQPLGERFTVTSRSGSGKLNGILDEVMASESAASVPPERAHHDISAANYRVRLLGTEIVNGHNCYVLELAPKARSRFLIVGKAWVDASDYGVVRLSGQYAASMSVLVGAPHLDEDFIEVQGFWLPGHVRSITNSVLLGPTELEIVFSNYRIADPRS